MIVGVNNASESVETKSSARDFLHSWIEVRDVQSGSATPMYIKQKIQVFQSKIADFK